MVCYQPSSVRARRTILREWTKEFPPAVLENQQEDCRWCVPVSRDGSGGKRKRAMWGRADSDIYATCLITLPAHMGHTPADLSFAMTSRLHQDRSRKPTRSSKQKIPCRLSEAAVRLACMSKCCCRCAAEKRPVKRYFFSCKSGRRPATGCPRARPEASPSSVGTSGLARPPRPDCEWRTARPNSSPWQG